MGNCGYDVANCGYYSSKPQSNMKSKPDTHSKLDSEDSESDYQVPSSMILLRRPH